MHPHDTPHGTRPSLPAATTRILPPTIQLHTLDEIWLYGRNSTDEQKKECTIRSQKEAVYHHAAELGEHIACEYVDEGRSGFTLVREALDRLREDAAAPGARCRIVRIYDKSRLARKATLRHIVEDELAHLGIRVEYIAAQIFDDSPEGQFAEGITDNLDEYFAAKTKQNLTRGRYYDIRNGHVWWAPYGYRLVAVPGQEWPAVQVDEELRPVVREIVERTIGHESAGLIARDLNKRGIPSPAVVLASARGKPMPLARKNGKTLDHPVQWTQKTIWSLLHNPYYAGHAAFDRYGRCLPADPKKRYRKKEKSSTRSRPPEQWFTIEVPAIMTDAEQQVAQLALATGQKRNPRNTKAQYLLRGLLRCPQCGGRLVCRRDDPDTPKERRFYRCVTITQTPGTTKTTTCRNRVGAADIEPLIVAHLAKRMENQEKMRAAFDQLRRKPDRERAQCEARLADLADEQRRLEKQRDGIYQMRELGETTPAQFNERRAKMESALAAITGQISEAQAHLGRARDQQMLWAGIEAFCAEMAGRFRQYTEPEHFEQRQRAVQHLVEVIDVYPDRFEVHGMLEMLDGDLPRQGEKGSFTSRTSIGLTRKLPFTLVLARVQGRQLQQGLDGRHDAGGTFVLG